MCAHLFTIVIGCYDSFEIYVNWQVVKIHLQFCGNVHVNYCYRRFCRFTRQNVIVLVCRSSYNQFSGTVWKLILTIWWVNKRDEWGSLSPRYPTPTNQSLDRYNDFINFSVDILPKQSNFNSTTTPKHTAHMAHSPTNSNSSNTNNDNRKTAIRF